MELLETSGEQQQLEDIFNVDLTQNLGETLKFGGLNKKEQQIEVEFYKCEDVKISPYLHQDYELYPDRVITENVFDECGKFSKYEGQFSGSNFAERTINIPKVPDPEIVSHAVRESNPEMFLEIDPKLSGTRSQTKNKYDHKLFEKYMMLVEKHVKEQISKNKPLDEMVLEVE